MSSVINCLAIVLFLAFALVFVHWLGGGKPKDHYARPRVYVEQSSRDRTLGVVNTDCSGGYLREEASRKYPTMAQHATLAGGSVS